MEEVQAVMGVPEWFLYTDSRETKALYGDKCIQGSQTGFGQDIQFSPFFCSVKNKFLINFDRFKLCIIVITLILTVITNNYYIVDQAPLRRAARQQTRAGLQRSDEDGQA